MFWIDRHLLLSVYLLSDVRPHPPRTHAPPIHKYTQVHLLSEPTHNNVTSKSLQNNFVLLSLFIINIESENYREYLDMGVRVTLW